MLSVVSKVYPLRVSWLTRCSGWEIYFTDLYDGETPCYTMPATTNVPGSSPTVSGITIITEHVFTQKFNLVATPPKNGLSGGAKAGIAVGIVLVVMGLGGGTIVLWLRRRKSLREIRAPVAPAPETEKKHELQSPISAHELPSPGLHEPPQLLAHPLPLSSHRVPEYQPLDVPQKPPQELPGSYFIHQHHPAFTIPPQQEEHADVISPVKSKDEAGGNNVISPVDSS